TIAGCAIILLGVPIDLVGECLNMMGLTRPGLAVEEFARIAWLYGLVSAALANGLYCLGGLVLSLVSWQAAWLRGWLGVVGFVMWSVGMLLTLTALVDFRLGMVVSGGAVMALFVPWAAVVGWRFSYKDLPLERNT